MMSFNYKQGHIIMKTKTTKGGPLTLSEYGPDQEYTFCDKY